MPGKNEEVEEIEGTIKPSTFINRYAIKSRPVVLTGSFLASPGIKTWDDTYLGNAPTAAMTNITVYDSSQADLMQTSISMREFIKSSNTDLFLFDQVPSFLMKDLVFPRVFKCDAFLKNLNKHILSYYKRVIITEPVRAAHDRLICPVRGKSSYVLVKANQWDTLSSNDSTIDYSTVDLETHPWLSKLNYRSVSDLTPGSCVYVPASWYVQSTYPDTPSATVVFSWRQQAEKVNKAACGEQDLKTEHHLGVYSGRFTLAKEQRDATKDALIHYFTFYLGEQLSSTFTVKQFFRKLKRDTKLFGRLVNWTDEISDISAELFELLDLNGDGKFSVIDINQLQEEGRESLVSQIQDRLHDFGGVMDEQQKEKKEREALEKKKQQASSAQQQSKPAPKPAKSKPAPVAPSAASGGGDDLASEFKAEMQKEIDKMMAELKEEKEEAEREIKEGKKTKNNKKEKSSKEAEPLTREEIKRNAKIKASKKKLEESANSSKNTKSRSNEKYRTIDEEEEIEIIAEEEETVEVKDKSKTGKGDAKVKNTEKPAPKTEKPAPKIEKPASKTEKPSPKTEKSSKEPKKSDKSKDETNKKEEL